MKFAARIAVFGGRDISKDIYNDTVKIGENLANENYLVYCGGGGGVMEAIAKGVKSRNGTTVGILKGDDISEGNEYLTVPVLTNMGITRNGLLAYNCDAAVAISGNHGTLSEIAYALQLNVPVFGYKTWDIPGVVEVKSVDGLVEKIREVLS